MEIQIRGITRNYGQKQVLRGIDLSCRGGQCVGILGANGSGKTTLLGILAGVLRSGGGEFSWDGQDLFRNESRRATMVGYVPQNNPLMEELSAWDNLLLWYDRATLQQELNSGVLRMLGIDAFSHVPVRKLSGGMKKRLSIGCAMAKRPPILLLDEPTAALDLAGKAQIADYLRAYKASGGLILLATHDVLELELCDSLYILKEGKLQPYEYDGNLEKLVQSL